MSPTISRDTLLCVKLSKCKISANVFLSDASFKNENVENVSEETLTLHL